MPSLNQMLILLNWCGFHQRQQIIVPKIEVQRLFGTAGDYRVEERPVPEIGDGEVLVKVLAVGICAGDAKCFAGAPYFWGER